MERTATTVYPFVKCLAPQVIYNKYTQEKMMVSCGKCEACLSRKSSMSTLKVQLESFNHKYSKFVTLTYSNDSCPRLQLVNTEQVLDEKGYTHELVYPYVYVEKEPRLDGERLRGIYNLQSFENHRKLLQKVENDSIPYLCKRDVQLFIKRLRRYYERLSKKTGKKYGEIRYFACGEYGPVHFRPHYHLILWTSVEETRKTLPQAVRACWKLGRVSTETPRDDVSKYVAKYVNGSSYLPEVFKSSEIKPFSLHSQHLGEQIFQERKEKIYESPAENIIKQSCFINGANTDVYMWRSLKTYYFPRCKAYDLCSPSERLYAYTLSSRAKDILSENYDVSTISSMAHSILSYLQYMKKYNILLTGQWHPEPLHNDFYRYFIERCDVNPYHLGYDDYYKRAFRSLYMVLRLSNHFERFCCDGKISRAPMMLDLIEAFYKDCDAINLKNQYQELEEFSQDWFDDEEECSLCFGLFPYEITKTNVYKRFRAKTLNTYSKSMKHKILNDKNKIFENLK